MGSGENDALADDGASTGEKVVLLSECDCLVKKGQAVTVWAPVLG